MKTFESFYVKKNYGEALQYLEKHERDLDPQLWNYSVGTVYAKLENFPMARFHLLQAEKKGLKNKEVFQNLEFVENKLEVNRLEKSISVEDHAIKAGLILSEGILVTIGLLFLVVGLFLLKKKKSFLRMMSLLVFVAIPFAINFWIHHWQRAIIVAPQTLFSGPSAIFESRGEIPSGVQVLYKGNKEWKEIIWPSRFHGWVKNADLKNLE